MLSLMAAMGRREIGAVIPLDGAAVVQFVAKNTQNCTGSPRS